MVYEREGRKQGGNEINDKRGREQTVTGPVISIPYREYVEDEKGKTTTVTKYLHMLPDTVNIDSRITPEVRYRGIYQAVLYNWYWYAIQSETTEEARGRRYPRPDC